MRQETILATTINTKATLHQPAIHELKEFVLLTVYLYITLGAVVLMKTAVLHTEGTILPPGASPLSRPRSWPNSCCSVTQ